MFRFYHNYYESWSIYRIMAAPLMAVYSFIERYVLSPCWAFITRWVYNPSLVPARTLALPAARAWTPTAVWRMLNERTVAVAGRRGRGVGYAGAFAFG